jgi:hypothetical protein
MGWKKAATAVAVATTALSFGTLAGAAEASTGLCPSGHVCLYTESAYNNTYGTPYRKFYDYRTYNLSNEYGTRVMINAQTNNAKVYLCYGYKWGELFPGPQRPLRKTHFQHHPHQLHQTHPLTGLGGTASRRRPARASTGRVRPTDRMAAAG